MSGAMASGFVHKQCFNQDSFTNKCSITDDEQCSGSEKDEHLEESFDRQGDDGRLCVQDIINYFESKAEASTSAKQKLDSFIHISSVASLEKGVSRRWSYGASNGLSQRSINDQRPFPDDRCLSTYGCGHSYEAESTLLQARRVVNVSNEDIKSNQRFDDEDDQDQDAALSSQSWGGFQGYKVADGSHCYLEKADILENSIGREGTHSDDSSPAYEPNMNKEQYLLAYDSKLRLRSETMRLPASNARSHGEDFPSLTKYETEILDDTNLNVYPKIGASDESFSSPKRRGVWDPLLQSHMYPATKSTSRWRDLGEVDQTLSSNCFFDPGWSVSNEQAEYNSWKRNCNNGEEPFCQNADAFCVNNKRSDDHAGDLLVIPERSARGSRLDRSSMFPLDCDIKLMNEHSYEYQQNPQRRKKNSGENMSTRTKTEPPRYNKDVKTLHMPSRRSDVLKVESQRSVRRLKSLNNEAEVEFRSGIVVSKNDNPSKAKKVQILKPVDDARSHRKDRPIAQRIASGPSKSVNSLPHVTSAKAQNVSTYSPSSSNAGKVMLRHLNPSSSSSKSSSTDPNSVKHTDIQRRVPTVSNRTVTDNQKPRRHSDSFSTQLSKDNNNVLHERTRKKSETAK